MCWGVIFKILICFGGSFSDTGALPGGHFNKFYKSNLQSNNEHEVKLNLTAITSKHLSCKYDCIRGELQCDL